MKFACLLLTCLAAPSFAAPAADAVPELPLFGAPPTKHYSGYLDGKGTDANPGCAATEKACQLHYWFAEAEEDPANKPVVLWLNGGPGSSSILGMLQEHGPLLINATGGLMVNPYAWTKLANVLVLESPTGVGYSYCSTQVAGGVCKNTDKLTAAAARAGVVDFFSTKFPELKKNSFFITGESYAGVYVPTLSRELIDNAKGDLNFAGYAVGDPCTDNTAQQDSMDMLWYGHKNGFVPEQEFDYLWNTCKARSTTFLGQGRWTRAEGETFSSMENDKFDAGPMFKDTPECTAAYRKFLASTSEGFSQGWVNAWINNLSLYGPSALVSMDTPGSLNYMTAQYMMRPDVQKALHVDSGPSKVWPGVKQGFDYTSDYDACNGNPTDNRSMIDFHRYNAPKLEIAVVFNGDTDPCVSYEGTRVAMTRVGFGELDGGGYRPWFYNHTAATYKVLAEKPILYGPDLLLTGSGPQFGGHIVNYENHLSFMTVHGSGHMVPQFRPQAALHMLAKVLSKDMFAPLLPTNHSLMTMNDSEYQDALDAWTIAAKAAPYVTGE
jgi:cathepsin A (carboxypeptidase C)